MSSVTLSLPAASRERVLPAAAEGEPSIAPRLRRISSHRLLAGERELVIQHMGSEYHLRLTRNGKLILTK